MAIPKTPPPPKVQAIALYPTPVPMARIDEVSAPAQNEFMASSFSLNYIYIYISNINNIINNIIGDINRYYQ